MRRQAGRAIVAALVLGIGIVGIAVIGVLPVRAQVPTIPTLPGQTTTTTTPPTSTPSTTAAPPDPTTSTQAPAATTSTSAQTGPVPPPEVFESIPVDPVSGITTTPITAPAQTARGSAPALPVTVAIAGISAAAVSGSFGLGVAGVFGFSLILIGFASAVRPGGLTMTNQRRSRLYAATAVLAAAAIVGLVGYLKLSLEPQVNRQIPYLASAGMALVLLAAIGGALLVGEQMRTDERRIIELEESVKTLAKAMSTFIEAPARRAVDTAVVEVDRSEVEDAELAETLGATAATRTRRPRTGTI